VLDCKVFKTGPEELIRLCTAWLVDLSLRCNTGNGRTWAVAFGQPRLSTLIIADRWIDIKCFPWRSVGVGQSEAAEEGEFCVSSKSRRSPARSEVEEIEIVIPNYVWDGCQSQDCASQGWLEDMNAEDNTKNGPDESWPSELNSHDRMLGHAHRRIIMLRGRDDVDLDLNLTHGDDGNRDFEDGDLESEVLAE